MHVYQVELIPDFIYIYMKYSKISNNSQLVKLFNTFALFSTHFSKFYFIVLLFFMFSNVKENLDNNFHARNACVPRGWGGVGTPVYPVNLHFKMMIMIDNNNRKIAKNFDLMWREIRVRVCWSLLIEITKISIWFFYLPLSLSLLFSQNYFKHFRFLFHKYLYLTSLSLSLHR